MDEETTTYSVIVPVYNSEDTLEELVGRLTAVMDGLGERWELVCVNDGSRDGSWEALTRLAKGRDNLVAINLSRNFGQHNAIMCGLHYASGRGIITIDDDLQHPPEEIPKLIARADEGYDVVYGAYEEKRHSVFRNLGSAAVQLAYRKVFGVGAGLSSFRYIRGVVAKKILTYDRSFTFIDGLLAWYTTRFSKVSVVHEARKTGRSGYSALRLLDLAMNLVTNFSTWPLKVTTVVGFSFALIAALIGIYFAVKKVVLGIPVPGYTSLVVAITAFAGVQLMALGMVGEYIGRVHINVNKRPQFSVETILPINEKEELKSVPPLRTPEDR